MLKIRQKNAEKSAKKREKSAKKLCFFTDFELTHEEAASKNGLRQASGGTRHQIFFIQISEKKLVTDLQGASGIDARFVTQI